MYFGISGATDSHAFAAQATEKGKPFSKIREKITQKQTAIKREFAG